MSFAVVSADLGEYFLKNCLIFALTLIGAIPLGLIITFGSMSKFKPVSWLVRTIIWVIRGTPLMLQLFVVMFVPGIVFNTPMKSRFAAVIIAFVINYAAYFSEIFRGGIEAVPHGQYEAGMVLGMTRTQVFFRVVLAQVVKRIIAPMGNEVITLVKDTSLARIISYAEIIRAAERYANRGVIWPLFYTGAFFLVFVGVLTLLFGRLEKSFSYYRV